MKTQLQHDLFSVLAQMPTQALLHYEANQSRLIHGHYVKGDGRCFMSLLTEGRQLAITSKDALAMYFTSLPFEQADLAEAYQAPKWIVRWWDGHSVERYGHIAMAWDERKALALECVRAEIARRQASELAAKGALSAPAVDASAIPVGSQI